MNDITPEDSAITKPKRGRPIKPFDKFHTIAETCEIFGVSRATLYNWIKKGIIPFIVKTPGGIRIPASSIKSYFDSMMIETGTENRNTNIELDGDTQKNSIVTRRKAIMAFEAYYKISESCDILGISRGTIYNWIRSGVIPFIVKTPGGTRIPASSLHAFFESRKIITRPSAQMTLLQQHRMERVQNEKNRKATIRD